MNRRFDTLAFGKITVANTQQTAYKPAGVLYALATKITLNNYSGAVQTVRLTIDPQDENVGEDTQANAAVLLWDVNVFSGIPYHVNRVHLGPSAALNIRASHASVTFSVMGIEVRA